MRKDTKQTERVTAKSDEQVIKEIEKTLWNRAQWLIANDPECCQLQGALNYANGMYKLKDNEQSIDGASE